MIEISVNKIIKNYGFNNVLNEISFDVHKGEIVSLVGSNASGKSTLLKIIYGDELPNGGTIAIRNGASIGFLNQIHQIEKDNVLIKEILFRSIQDILDVEMQLKEYENLMQTVIGRDLERLLKKYGNLSERFVTMGGYETSEKIGRIVTGFKISNLLEKEFNTLSGGEKSIVLFAALMIKNPDILLLDEPTNHLDIPTLKWLEEYLKSYSGTIIVVSHDRYFLNRVSNKTILIESGKEDIYFGNYNYYLEEKEKRNVLEFKNYKDQQKEIKAMKDAIKRLREWGRVGDNEQFFKRANSIEKRLEKMDRIDKPIDKKTIPLNFNMNERSGKEVVSITNLNIQYDKVIFNNANLFVRYKERICLFGANGSGKTTLINAILNGHNNIKLGTNIKVGYIEQNISFDDENISILEEAKKYFFKEEQLLRSALFKFMFYGENIYKKLSKLSGGEKVRLKLFCLIQQDINLLILDEPTNHIDISTREILEDALNEYEGTILFVSHDRYFINKVATKIVAIQNNKLIEYPGNYDYYEQKKIM